jgi:GT2 family glycosyltransferase
MCSNVPLPTAPYQPLKRPTFLWRSREGLCSARPAPLSQFLEGPVTTELPTVSVIVPTRSRSAALRACLAALCAQQYPRDRLEIIVVYDGELPPAGLGGGRVTVLRQRRAGAAAARNLGASERPGAGAGGRTVSPAGATRWSETADRIIALSRATLDDEPDRVPFLASGNLLVTAHGFRSIGGFDQSFVGGAEDRDLCDRWIAAGAELLYEPAALVVHDHRHTLRSFFATHVAYGAGAYRLQQTRLALAEPPRLVDRRFYRKIAASVVTYGPGYGLRLLVWQAANLVGYGGAWIRDRGLSRSTLGRTST